jgi:hypothetical protein
MKTKILLAALLSIAVVLMAEAKPVRPKIKKDMEKQIKYPQYMINNQIEGVVEVTFSFNSDGQIEIKKVDTDDQLLRDEVVWQLYNLQLDASDYEAGKMYKVQIRFSLIR